MMVAPENIAQLTGSRSQVQGILVHAKRLCYILQHTDQLDDPELKSSTFRSI